MHAMAAFYYYLFCLYLFFCQAAISVKISNLLICFCSIDFSCPSLEKIILLKNCIFFNLVCFDLV